MPEGMHAFRGAGQGAFGKGVRVLPVVEMRLGEGVQPLELLNEAVSIIRECSQFANVYFCRAGGVISSHCGPMTFSVVFCDN